MKSILLDIVLGEFLFLLIIFIHYLFIMLIRFDYPDFLRFKKK